MINVWMYVGILSVFSVGMAVYYIGCSNAGIALIFVAGLAAVGQMIREEIVSEKRRNKDV